MDNEVIDYARGSLETPWRLSIFYGNPWTVVRGTSVLACPRVGMSFHHRGEINELFMPTGSTVLAKGRWSTTNVNCMLARCLLVEEEVVTACNIRTMAFFPFCKMHKSGPKWQCTMPCRAIEITTEKLNTILGPRPTWTLFTLFETQWKPRCDHKYGDRLRMQSNYAMQPCQGW